MAQTLNSLVRVNRYKETVGGGAWEGNIQEILAAVTVAVVATHLNRMKDPPPRKSPASCVYFNPSWGSYRDKHRDERWK